MRIRTHQRYTKLHTENQSEHQDPAAHVFVDGVGGLCDGLMISPNYSRCRGVEANRITRVAKRNQFFDAPRAALLRNSPDSALSAGGGLASAYLAGGGPFAKRDIANRGCIM